jgi:AhpD family alkylhydroperoxidase
MKRMLAAALLVFAPMAAHAQSAPPPKFMQDIYPKDALNPAWQEFQAVMGKGALDAKTKELIGLATAAQIPCRYCIYYHTQAAKSHGASDEEIREALASAALVRKWSTMLNGMEYDEASFHGQVDAAFKAGAQQTGSTK